MKKILITLCAFIVGLGANAAVTADQALSFFSKYVDAANAYQEDIISFYSPDAKIIRTVMLPKGGTTTVSTNMNEYANQMRLGSSMAKMRKYKNFYTDRKIVKVGDNFKITCLRQPSTSTYKIPAHFVIGEDSKGKLKIKEEMMYTKEQSILKVMKK